MKTNHTENWPVNYRPHSPLCNKSKYPNPEDWPCNCETMKRDFPPDTYTRPLPHACCDKAVPIQCVCAYAYDCPEHGITHIGTHD